VVKARPAATTRLNFLLAQGEGFGGQGLAVFGRDALKLPGNQTGDTGRIPSFPVAAKDYQYSHPGSPLKALSEKF
jgi:hypothetical protein